MAGTDYELDLDPPKKNVFVTQLHTREDEDEGVSAYPVIKESASKLLETGVNTLQRTLLLKKEVEVDRVDEELEAKREEFRKRMETCSERQIDIQKKQLKMKDLVMKFEKYIKENEAKRRRAIQKYQIEVKLKEQKSQEYDMLCANLDELKARHQYLKNKLARYKIYEIYLNRVIDILPAHYLEVNDSMLSSLMMRYRTLSATNQSVVENVQAMVDALESQKQELDDIKQDHNKKKVYINSQLSQMQKQQEIGVNHNQELEQQYFRGKKNMREQRAEFGQIMMAIGNLAEKCQQRLIPSQEDISVEDKLEVIKKFIGERSDIVQLAGKIGDGSASPSSERRIKFAEGTQTVSLQKHS